jgi:hypothetical protein
MRESSWLIGENQAGFQIHWKLAGGTIRQSGGILDGLNGAIARWPNFI